MMRLVRLVITLIPIFLLFSMLSQTKAEDLNCTLEVPANPTQNLSTPWILDSPCSMADQNQQVFLQAVILTPNKQLLDYDPLVVNQGQSPAIPPLSFTPPSGSVVGILGGGNDNITTLVGSGASSCVNGADGHQFGQVFFCNTANLLGAINNSTNIPGIGSDIHGNPCPTVRSFKLVDQDQSDNVQTTYLVTADGRTAQNNAANRAALGGSVAKNPSDNRLLTNFVDPAIGCHAWSIPDISSDSHLTATQATDELQALHFQSQPVALIPAGDPMVGPNDLGEVNAYRQSLLQPSVDSLVHAATFPYCGKMQEYAPPFFAEFKQQFQASGSPAPGVNLYNFIVGRYQASLQILGCPV